jgi:glyoxylase-like metal-dependent hydrolase (beta-lactamase superfamily II)
VYILYAEFPHADSGNVYLITGERPTLIDCGGPRAVPRIVANLAQLGLQVSDNHQVLATHGDYDHVQGFHGLRQLNPNLRIALHPRDWPIVQLDNAWGNASYLYGQPFVPFDAGDCQPLEDGEAIPAGDTALTVIHTPGHTEGSTCFLGTFGGQAILFAGDAFGGAMHSLDGVPIEAWAQAVATWRQSLQHLATFEFAWVLNGHEPARSLPLPRSSFDRHLPHFGKMLNPWFLREDEEPTLVPIP